MSEISIREFQPGDIESFHALHDAVFPPVPFEEMRRWMARDDVTAGVAVHDKVTHRLHWVYDLDEGDLDRFRERGVRVPHDVSVVGCDDVFGADLVQPTLTTVHSPNERAGFHAADLLLTRLDPMHDDAELSGVLLPTHLVPRDSSGPAPRADRLGAGPYAASL